MALPEMTEPFEKEFIMTELTDFEIEFHKIDLFTPEGFVAVCFTINFHIEEGTRYTVIDFNIPVKLSDNMKIEEAKQVALGMAKTYLSDLINRQL